MRILVVDPQAYTPPYDHALCAALAARGLEVELTTARFLHGRAPEPEGYRRDLAFGPLAAGIVAHSPRSPARVPLKLAGHLRGLAELVRRSRRNGPDVIHWQWAPFPRADLRALRAAHAGATVFTAHDVLPRRSAGAIPLWRELYGACDRVIVHSHASRDRLLLEVGGIGADRVAVVPHALFDDVRPVERRPQPSPTILFFGLIRPDKGLDVLIEALPGVPGARLEVVGSPLMAIEPLQERARALGLEERICWDLRFVDDATRDAAFARASVVCLPYRWIEGSGVLATALARGVPVVTTSVGSFPELCAAYDLGAPVSPEDPDELARALVEMLADGPVRSGALAGIARSRQELTWERAALQTEQLYREALDEQRA